MCFDGDPTGVDMYIFGDKDVHVSEAKKIRWTIASARQNLPTLVGMAAREPQDIYRRDELVARVVSADSPPQLQAPSAAELLARIQRAIAEEAYDLPVATRVDRPNALVEGLGTKRKRRRKAKAR